MKIQLPFVFESVLMFPNADEKFITAVRYLRFSLPRVWEKVLPPQFPDSRQVWSSFMLLAFKVSKITGFSLARSLN